MILTLMKDELRRDESTKLKPYLDCCGKPWRQCACTEKGNLTIGTGRNLDAFGITSAEDDYLLANNIGDAAHSLDMAFPWWRKMSEARQRALLNMCFNMGLARLLGFTNMLNALRVNDWAAAAKEALDSDWAREVGARAQRIAATFVTG